MTVTHGTPPLVGDIPELHVQREPRHARPCRTIGNNTTQRSTAMALDAVYHATIFEPTVDELSMLKRLEMGELVSMTAALREHLSVRLLEW
ncbi:hypothetical protein SDC9_175680 [bioreactor metagenome]|uniref:Uncharacterized protein n=1 Tax=bioreactor metagenome TaxID=1076179 RepID=A0A645GQS0_9ZZZZ